MFCEIQVRWEMKPIAGNPNIERKLRRCLCLLEGQDKNRFLRSFRNYANETEQQLHVYRELLLGAYLRLNGLDARYEKGICGSKPDWCVVDKGSTPIGIIELRNFHVDRQTQRGIDQNLARNGCWSGFIPDKNDKRLRDVIERKSSKYKALVQKKGLWYVVALFATFDPFLTCEEFRAAIPPGMGFVSGWLYFEERKGEYLFDYLPDSGATILANLPEGKRTLKFDGKPVLM